MRLGNSTSGGNMKKILSICLSLVGLTFLSPMAKAAPILFELNHVNHAWGYMNRGCFVDEKGFIYKYDHAVDVPFQHIGRATDEELQEAQNLARAAKGGTFHQEHALRDAGSKLWTAQVDGKKVLLAQWGDIMGTNSAPEAQKLAEQINQWCKSE